MTAEEYQGALLLVIQAGRMLQLVDVDDLLRRIEHADAFGSILDPTLYREKHGAMMEDKALLEAARPLRRLMDSLAARKAAAHG